MASDAGPVGPLLALDPADPSPLHEQIEQALRAAVRSGRLAAGSPLPSSRALSMQLGISRGVVSWAYGQLAAEGYLITRQGAPVRVSDTIRGVGERPTARSLATPFAYDLRPLPDLAAFPRDRWQRSLREAWRAMPASGLADLDPRGIPQVRDALAGYLERVRGADADPELVICCSGFTQGFSLACRWLAGSGVARIAVEEPGWHHHRLIAEQAGLETVPIRVDASGIDVSALEQSGVSAVVLTPARQFPTGAVLSALRRGRLLDWAEREDALIIEDDYDSELRFEGAAVGALQGLSPERVLHIGSAGKRLAPGLRLGWMLVPSWLTWPLTFAKAVEDAGSEVLGQLALADFINCGEFDRHLRRMRLLYAKRRRLLVDLLADVIPGATTGDDPAGLFELVELPDGMDGTSLLAAAAACGVGLESASLHHDDSGSHILIGYAGVSEPALERALRLLGAAIAR